MCWMWTSLMYIAVSKTSLPLKLSQKLLQPGTSSIINISFFRVTQQLSSTCHNPELNSTLTFTVWIITIVYYEIKELLFTVFRAFLLTFFIIIFIATVYDAWFRKGCIRSQYSEIPRPEVHVSLTKPCKRPDNYEYYPSKVCDIIIV